jgi:uncharacterized iron-regulated membrane protein
MKFSVLNRKVHYWLSLVVALPALVIIATGLLLQLKKEVPWVQPPEQRGSGKEPTIALAQVLYIAQRTPKAEVRTWADISRVDIRPSRGMLKVVTKSSYEIQIDTQNGKVLQVAYRRSDLIESIHDGSWFDDWVKLWIFLPAGIILLVLWLTGVYLFWLPIVVRRRRKPRSGPAPPSTPPPG